MYFELGRDAPEVVEFLETAAGSEFQQGLFARRPPRVRAEGFEVFGSLEGHIGLDRGGTQVGSGRALVGFEPGDRLERLGLDRLRLGNGSLGRVDRSMLGIDVRLQRLERSGELFDVVVDDVDLGRDLRRVLLDLLAFFPQFTRSLGRGQVGDGGEGDQSGERGGAPTVAASQQALRARAGSSGVGGHFVTRSQ